MATTPAAFEDRQWRGNQRQAARGRSGIEKPEVLPIAPLMSRESSLRCHIVLNSCLGVNEVRAGVTPSLQHRQLGISRHVAANERINIGATIHWTTIRILSHRG